MAKPRSIDPLFWDDEDIANLSRDERLMIIGIVTVFADDEGRFPAEANAIRKRLFADDRDITTEIVAGWLSNIAQRWHNFKLYTVRDKQYGWFASWDRWQPMKYKSKSKFPEFSKSLQVWENSHKLSQIVMDHKNCSNLSIGRDGCVGLSRVELSTDGTDGESEAKTSPSVVSELKCKEPTELTCDSFPLTDEAVRMYFPVSDDAIIVKIVLSAISANPKITDTEIAAIIHSCYSTGQRSVGMFLSTVPNWIAKAKVRGLPVNGEPIRTKHFDGRKPMFP